jgi:hypothetical protein
LTLGFDYGIIEKRKGWEKKMRNFIFIVMNLLGILFLGDFFLRWWLSVYDAGLVNLPISIIVSILYIIFSAIQVIYVGGILSGEDW